MDVFFFRLATELASSIATGKTESMNNPVSKTRLKELYDEQRQQWPEIKRNLKANKENPESVKALIQVQFCEIKLFTKINFVYF